MSSYFLIDTNIWISVFARGRHEGRLFELIKTPGLLVSAVTLSEFLRGAHDSKNKLAVKQFFQFVNPFLVTPTQSQWIETGWILEGILRGSRRTKEKILLLQNDILIALTARDQQARLITHDRKDFSLLERFIDLEVEYW